MEQQQERVIKKRKTILNHIFSEDILSEIVKYFNSPVDYLNLSNVNQYFYHLMLLTDNIYLFKLQKLNVNTNDKNCNVLQKFTNLKTLKAKNLKGRYLKTLGTNLEELEASFWNLDEFSFSNLKQLKDLTILDLENTEFKYFRYLPNLQSLKILDSPIMDDSLIILKNLTKLNLKKCCDISGDCFKYFKQLTYLNVQNCSKITDNCLVNLNHLTSLNILYCNSLNGTFLQHLTQLQHLKISVTDDNFYNINNYAAKLNNLTFLKIDWQVNFNNIDGKISSLFID
ncbi:hypothetical protein ABK040_004314 [Willaertia magna]